MFIKTHLNNQHDVLILNMSQISSVESFNKHTKVRMANGDIWIVEEPIAKFERAFEEYGREAT